MTLLHVQVPSTFQIININPLGRIWYTSPTLQLKTYFIIQYKTIFCKSTMQVVHTTPTFWWVVTLYMLVLPTLQSLKSILLFTLQFLGHEYLLRTVFINILTFACFWCSWQCPGPCSLAAAAGIYGQQHNQMHQSPELWFLRFSLFYRNYTWFNFGWSMKWQVGLNDAGVIMCGECAKSWCVRRKKLSCWFTISLWYREQI